MEPLPLNCRDSLLSALGDYRTAWPREAPMVERIAELVRGHTDCFERECRPGHVTASAWVMTADGEASLLLRHKKLNKWLQPGGHADGDADLVAVARREVAEETGLTSTQIVAAAGNELILDIDVHAIPARHDDTGRLIEDSHEHHDIRFLLLAEAGQEVTGNDESHGVQWCDRETVHRLTAERSVLRLLEKADARLRSAQGS